MVKPLLIFRKWKNNKSARAAGRSFFITGPGPLITIYLKKLVSQIFRLYLNYYIKLNPEPRPRNNPDPTRKK